MTRFLAFCEARSDFDLARCLVERKIRACGPQWLAELFETNATDAIAWTSEGTASFIKWADLKEIMSALKVRPTFGHFQGEPGKADASAGRNALAIARRLAKRDGVIRGIVFVRDADDQVERRIGLEQARTEGQGQTETAIAIGVAEPMREAWVLAGFVPTSDQEKRALAECRKELGFDPCTEAHRLDAKDEGAKRNPKRVLAILSAGDRDREELCFRMTDVESMAQRGNGSGLAKFLVEVAERFVPVFTKAPKQQ